VVAEHTVGPKSNKFVERVGTVNPKTKETQLNNERIAYWLSVGAQASGRVHNMLVKAGLIKADTINVLPQKSPVVDEEAIAKEKEAAEAKEAAEEEATNEEKKEETAEEPAEEKETETTEEAAPAEEAVEEEKKSE
jgi:small subunit ribosomal protein S16